MVNSAEAKVMW